MSRIEKIKRRKIAKRWVAFGLLTIIPFVIFFTDALLNIQVRLKDYKLSGLNTEMRQLEAELIAHTSRLSQLRGIENLTLEAKAMGLSAPNIHQFHAIAYRDVPKRLPMMRLNGFQVAHASPEPRMIYLEDPAERNAEPVESNAVEVSTVQVAETPTAPIEEPVAAIPDSEMAAMIPTPESPTFPPLPSDTATVLLDDVELSLLTVEDMLAKL